MLSNVTLFCWVTIIAWVVSLNFQKWQNIYKGSQVSCVAFEGCLLNAFFIVFVFGLWLVRFEHSDKWVNESVSRVIFRAVLAVCKADL